METRDSLLHATLKEYLDLLQVAVKGLDDAFKHCQEKSLDNSLQPRKLESFDALAMRFSRTADIFSQKVLRNIFILLREDETTFLDRARKAEKLNLITSADELILMRDLRNSITHEYVLENWTEIFQQVMIYTPLLMDDIDKASRFVKNKFNL